MEMCLSNSYLKTCCLLLLVLNFLLLGISSNDVVKTPNNNESTAIDRYQSSYIDLLENDGLVMPNLELLDVSAKSKKLLTELCDDDSILFICRVSQFHCQDCSSYVLEKAIKMFEGNSTNMKLVFFCDYEYRSLKIFLDKHPNLIGFEVYQVPIVNLPIEARTYPYFFTLSNNMVVHEIFLPDIDDPIRTDIYWNSISQKWR